jgi:hypothetical protein
MRDPRAWCSVFLLYWYTLFFQVHWWRSKSSIITCRIQLTMGR